MYNCPICQESLENDPVAAVKCGHTFHFHCINRWKSHSKTCPTCRFEINNFDQDVFPHLYFETSRESSASSGKLNNILAELENLKEVENRRNEVDEKRKCEIVSLKRKLIETEECMKILREKCFNYDALKDERDKLLVKYDNCKKNKLFFKRKLENVEIQFMEQGKKLRNSEKNLKTANSELISQKKLVKSMKSEILLLQTKPGQTPFNRDLKQVLIDSPDTPVTLGIATASKSATPVLKKRVIQKYKSNENVIAEKNQNVYDDQLFLSSPGAKKKRLNCNANNRLDVYFPPRSTFKKSSSSSVLEIDGGKKSKIAAVKENNRLHPKVKIVSSSDTIILD